MRVTTRTLGLLFTAAAMSVTPGVAQARTTLRAFSSCAQLVSFAREGAKRTDGSTGVPTRAPGVRPLVLAAPPMAAPARDGAAESGGPRPTPVAAAPAAGTDFSQTNNQEAEVDEPDVLKTDGRRVLAVVGSRLHVVDVTGPTPRAVGSLALAGSGHELLVRGDRVLVISRLGGFVGVDALSGSPVLRSSFAPSGPTKALLTEVDVSDPAAPKVARSLELDGAIVSARQTGRTARVVVASTPKPIAPDAVDRATLRSFVPLTTIRSRRSGRTFRRGVVPCDDVRRPASFSGLDLLTVLSVDLDRGLFSVDRDAILAGAQTVYASGRSLYVASRRYDEALEAGRRLPARARTEIHRFDASQPGITRYRSSGSVRGYVLNQYAMGERGDALRVATTDEPEFFDDGSSTEGESAVSVLREAGNVLRTVGRVGGLGKGERIYAVRFLGDRGYVVTFRETDPLYTLDLSRDTAPRVTGELKVLGYSAYLHPVSEKLLLGVGQDATPEGRRTGSQLSLFDVSDAAKPRRVARLGLGDGSSSAAEFDPHAFLYWPPTRLAVLPLARFGDRGTSFDGAVGYRVASDVIREVGKVAHPVTDGFTPSIGRSAVVRGDTVLTLSYAGLQSNSLDGLVGTSFLPLGATP